MAIRIPLTGAVEGATDEAALRRVVEHAGRELADVYVTGGKADLARRLPGFNSAAERAPWIVLIDLDRAECAPALIEDSLPVPGAMMTLRIVVRALEAWVLADSQRLASFLGVSGRRIPSEPEALADPKQSLVEVAQHSRRRAIREDMVPRRGSGRRVGPAFEARMIEFISDGLSGWRPQAAAEGADSLRRCLAALE